MAFLTNKLFIMQKFLKLQMAPNTGQLIALDGIKALGTASATATTVTIDYFDGTTTTVYNCCSSSFRRVSTDFKFNSDCNCYILAKRLLRSYSSESCYKYSNA
jgi:hypothetical protein